MYRLRTSVVEARAVGLPDSKVEAAATQLSQMEEVVDVRREAERELTFSLPGLFSKADPERMRTAIAAARGAGVAEATVADAEDKMARVLEREEEDRVRMEKDKARKLAEEAAKLEASDAKAAELVRAGHAANDRGAAGWATARAKFVAAYGHSKRPSTLVSAANMALKMGDAQTAVREYEKVLHASGLLKPSVAAAVEAKLGEARASLDLPPPGGRSPPKRRASFLGGFGGAATEPTQPSPAARKGSRPYTGDGRVEDSPRRETNALAPLYDSPQLWSLLRERLLAALLKAARFLLMCGVLAFVVAMVHVAWASRGDACRGLAAARGTLTLANATLAGAQETMAAPLRPLSALVARRLSADVLEPTVSLVSLLSAAAANRAPIRTARIATRVAALAALLSDACAAVLTAVLDRAEGATQ